MVPNESITVKRNHFQHHYTCYKRHSKMSIFLQKRVACITLMVLASALTPVMGFASVQGMLGPTSTGSVGISVTKVSAAKISGLNDMIVTWSASDNDIIWTNDVCVFSSRALGSYTIRASGSTQAGGAFTLSGQNQNLDYQVTWNAGGTGNLSNNGIALQPNVTSSALSGAATDNSTCNGNASGPTARLVITIPKTSLVAANAGGYADTLTLMISPN